MNRVVVVATVLALSGQALADDNGLYFAESFGVGIGRGDLQQYIGNPMHMRIAVGARVGDLAIEPWVTSDLQMDRDGAFRGIVGGTPAEGTADLASYGVDLKYSFQIDKHLSAYVRGGPMLASATGVLDGYQGYGFGAAGGFQISGQVRALGFLWSPLFFLKRGPLITGSLFLDQGYDFYRLKMPGARPINAHVGHVNVGFSLGSTF